MSKMNETAAARYVASNDLQTAYLNQARVARYKAMRAAFGALARWARGARPAALGGAAAGARTA